MAAVQVPPRQRFVAPAPSQWHGRPTAPGLGSPGASHDLPAEDLGELEQTLPLGGFTGYQGKSRFGSFTPPPLLGHGGTVEGLSTTTGEEYDPSLGRTRFPVQRALVWFDGLLGRLRTSALDTFSRTLTEEGVITYQRGRVDATVAGTRPPDMIRWGDPPFPRAYREPRYTLRPEFMQNAQAFLGLHSLVRKGGRMSTSPVRMQAPRTNRLTSRAQAGSYGQTTEVLQ